MDKFFAVIKVRYALILASGQIYPSINGSTRKIKMITAKTFLIVFGIGTLSPILALMVKPANYSFYMFLPGTPDTLIGRSMLLAGDILLVIGFALSLVTALVLAVPGLKRGKYLYFLCPVIVLVNPFQQPIFLESLDTYVNNQWGERAAHLKIVGKTPNEIQRLFGNPTCEWTETPRTLDRAGKVTWQGETYTGWDYHVLPFYWMGSKFQVFFVDGKVKNFEANDD